MLAIRRWKAVGAVHKIVARCRNIALGMVATACRTLLESLDRIPNEENRAKVAIIAFDSALYYFSMSVCDDWIFVRGAKH